MRFQRILKALGVIQAMREIGVKEGERPLRIAEVELIWGYDNAYQ